MSRNKEHRGAAFGGAPNGAAAEGGRPIGSVFFVSVHLFFYFMNLHGYSLYIPYTYIYMYIIFFSQIFAIHFPLCVS